MKHERSPFESPVGDLVAQELQQQVDVLEKQLAGLKTQIEDVAAGSPSSHPLIAQKVLRSIIEARRRREQIFGADMFADPAWDILLELYAAKIGQRRLSTTAVCSMAAVPATTALRWIAKLEESGWLEKQSDPLDGRRVWLHLSSRGVQAMDSYFDRCRREGLPV